MVALCVCSCWSALHDFEPWYLHHFKKKKITMPFHMFSMLWMPPKKIFFIDDFFMHYLHCQAPIKVIHTDLKSCNGKKPKCPPKLLWNVNIHLTRQRVALHKHGRKTVFVQYDHYIWKPYENESCDWLLNSLFYHSGADRWNSTEGTV